MRAGLAGLLLFAVSAAAGAEWQWSVPVENGRAFLWIPSAAVSIRAVVVGQNNLLEEPILEHPRFRQTLSDLGFAEVWIVPPFDPVFRFDRGAERTFDSILRALAESSGYSELASVPAVPIGHSALASFPWNFAAWRPERTLALISIKGDAPQTDLTGSGQPNPDWGSRSIDGIPALMVMGEYEWWERRLEPALRYRREHPNAPIAFLAEISHGHFSASDDLVDYLADFIRKAADARLPDLRPVNPRLGWLVDRWRGESPPQAPAAPFPKYRGKANEAFWCFDAEMARRTEGLYASGRGQAPQTVDFIQDGRFAPVAPTHTGVALKFEPEGDGVTFKLRGGYSSRAPHGSAPVRIDRVYGSVVRLGEDTFRVAFDRTQATEDRRRRDLWLLAEADGVGGYKHAEQQALLEIPPGSAAPATGIDFPAIVDQRRGVRTVRLGARDENGLPVSCYVREGPADVDGPVLRFTAIPPGPGSRSP